MDDKTTTKEPEIDDSSHRALTYLQTTEPEPQTPGGFAKVDKKAEKLGGANY
jgi:hypothetical protein